MGEPGLFIRRVQVQGRWDQDLKLVKRQAGQIQELRGALLYVGKLSMRHGRYLLS